MADTIGDVIGRGYRVGRQIGNDFSQWRYSRGEAKLREQYEAEAAQAGVSVDDYLVRSDVRGRLEADLDKLYQTSGAARRAVTGPNGEALNASSRGSFDERIARGQSRKAGALATENDIGGAMRVQAGSAYSSGDFASGLQYQQGGRMVDASKAAMGGGPNGGYDAAGAASAKSAIDADFGNMAGAIESDAAAQAGRFDAAKMIAGQMMPMIGDPTFADQLPAKFEAFKQYVPELANFAVRAGKDGNVVIFKGEQAVGSLDEPEEIKDMLTRFTNDPKMAMAEWVKSQLDQKLAAREEFEYQRGRSDKLLDDTRATMRSVIENMPGVDASLIEAVTETGEAAKADGWKQLSVSDEGVITATFGDQLYQILPGSPPTDGPNGLQPGSAFRIVDRTGAEVDPASLGSKGESLVNYAAANATLAMEAQARLGVEQTMTQLQLLNSMLEGGAATGGTGVSSVRGEPPQDPKIRDILSQAAAKYGVPKQYAFALAQQESGYNPNAYNDEYGATGLMQYIPGTAKQMGIDPRDPVQSADAAMKQFAERMKSGGVEEAIMAHFAGDGGGNRGPKTAQYVQDVMARASDIERAMGGGAPASTRRSAIPTVAQGSAVTAATTAAPKPRKPPVGSAVNLQQLRSAVASATEQERLAQSRLEQFLADRPQSGHIAAAGPGPSGSLRVTRGGTATERAVLDRLQADAEKARLAAQEVTSKLQKAQAIAITRTNKAEADALYQQYASGVASPGAGGDTAALNPEGHPVLNSIINQHLR